MIDLSQIEMRKVAIPERTLLSQPSSVSVVEASTRLDYLSRVTIESKVDTGFKVCISKPTSIVTRIEQ